MEVKEWKEVEGVLMYGHLGPYGRRSQDALSDGESRFFYILDLPLRSHSLTFLSAYTARRGTSS